MTVDEMIATLSRMAVMPSWPDLDLITVRAVRDVLAQYGLERAIGWIDGYWYVDGNRKPTGNPTWRAIRAVLGDPVADVTS